MRVRVAFEEPYDLDLGGPRALYGSVDEGASTDHLLVVRADESSQINGMTIGRIEVSARYIGASLRDVYERGFVIVNGTAVPMDGSKAIQFIGSLRIAGGGPRAPIFAAVTALEGLQMWGSARAADIEMFAFGRRLARHAPDGSEYEVGEFALRVQCAWRLWHQGRTYVGSRDDFDPMSKDAGKRDRLLRELFRQESLVVLAVHTGSSGYVRIRFESGSELELLPDCRLFEGKAAENWRFLAPGSDDPHLVCYSNGFSLE